ncbi:hypothetical protein [Bailinhaonella thermotolerans]|uniref:Uncharacterized protein n=1 Tax=Bailinhaonella thermotolerans TaxID=1070861 RepID=A0A3A4AE65_9ACTN|nr:hypothetical protein [Bailinhaonella thermotolerans]RJL23933.1 hypothetical protein D5H75_31340 [Bailinhaonella thermotolerans]
MNLPAGSLLAQAAPVAARAGAAARSRAVTAAGLARTGGARALRLIGERPKSAVAVAAAVPLLAAAVTFWVMERQIRRIYADADLLGGLARAYAQESAPPDPYDEDASTSE